MKDLNSNYLYSVEGLNCVALGRWSNDVELLVKAIIPLLKVKKKRATTALFFFEALFFAVC